MPAETIGFVRIGAQGEREDITRDLADESPIAIELNGMAYAVLMATPSDVEDLAYGFVHAERIVTDAADVRDIDVSPTGGGLLVRMTLAADAAGRVLDRVRHRAADSSCGLCGVETLEQAMRPLPQLPRRAPPDDAVLFRALGRLDVAQPLGRRTRAVHAAAWVAADGAIVRVREDVGRHNAFDKLIGSMRRAGEEWAGGFALLTSRCSYELVEKAVLAGCPTLATISAPTALAVRRAAEAGLHLRVLARPDAVLARDA